MSQVPRFVALDSLRGVAALGVAAYHLHGGGPLFDATLVRNAWVLVDFFFVLSGFVIAANYGARLASGFALPHFMALRLGRLYPLHLAVLAAYVALELGQYLFQPAGMTLREPFTGQHSFGHLLQTLLMVQGFSIDSTMSWNAQSWSISVELWLYLGMALLWRLLGRRGWIGAAVLMVPAALTFASGYTGNVEPFTYGALRGVLGFGTGVIAWQVWTYHAHQVRALPAPLLWELGALTLAGAAICFLLPLAWRFPVLDLVFAIVVLVFAAERGPVSRLLQSRPLVLCGTLSYSIYLIHLMVQGRTIDLLRLAGLGTLSYNGFAPVRAISAAPGWDSVIGVLILGLTVGAAWFTWRFIEMPAREWSRRLVSRS